MRVSREQAARNRDRVVETAGHLFRERGFDGVGIDDLMGAAGLTRGGFYKSFPSKEALIEAACCQTVERSHETWDGLLGRGEDPLRELVESYLSGLHRDNLASGCPYAGLAAEASRRPSPVKGIFREGIEAAIGKLARLMPGGAIRRRDEAIAALAGMVGALVLARAVDDAHLSEEILAAARRSVLARPSNPSTRDDGRGQPAEGQA